ncbi:MFS transporter [Lysinibacillus piscis]|uniref:MFS transporter n=1 Tax=Lysinibacillus piscis TaxID=2518931 RepID=A0ABQ5NML3_9BACI|nr:MFS transporter [Lysinibacillus sp. KH24]GLC89606.1 MFS transporter [Lysinibacillus sp. KH24]
MSKHYFLLLGGLGFSNLGNWIYLIALNLAIWHLTHSPAAVAGIYMIGPAARIISSFFAGSFIDRHNKKTIMIWSDIVRGIIVCVMPFLTSIWCMYSLIFWANIASSFFGPSSTYMQTKLVADAHRQRFNAIYSTLNSGSFMIGPALAGIIITASNTSVAMWVNGLTFFTCAIAIAFLPTIDNQQDIEVKRVTLQVIQADFKEVQTFIIQQPKLLLFLTVYTCALVLAYSLDSQEMTFLKEVLSVGDSAYGLMVSAAGIGAIIGGVCAAMLVKKIALRIYIGVGFALTMGTYLLFYLSSTVILATISFIALGFFMAFSNTGYATMYQRAISPMLMGRFGSSLNLVQSILQISLTFMLGWLAEQLSLQLVAVIFAVIACILAIYVCFLSMCYTKTLYLGNGENDE